MWGVYIPCLSFSHSLPPRSSTELTAVISASRIRRAPSSTLPHCHTCAPTARAILAVLFLPDVITSSPWRIWPPAPLRAPSSAQPRHHLYPTAQSPPSILAVLAASPPSSSTSPSMPHPRHPRHPCYHPCCPHHLHAVIFAAPLTTPAGNISRRARTSIWGLTSPPPPAPFFYLL
jgi:hypothetical protein